MDTGKVYYDTEGNECSIWQMVMREPHWAANRIQEGEKALDEIARLRAEVKALRVDAEICADLVQIVEGHFGAVHHGVWTDRAGLRLKDTKRWARFYVMAKKLDAAIDAARGGK